MEKKDKIGYFFIFLLCGLSLLVFTALQENKQGSPLFTTEIKMTSEGNYLLSNKGSRSVDLYTADFTKRIQTWVFDEIPTGVAVKGDYAYITTFETKGQVHFLNLKSNTLEAVVETASGATSPIISPDGKTLYVLNQFKGTISRINLATKEITGTVRVLREPKGAVIPSTGKYLFVTNFLPEQQANMETVASCVSVIDLDTFKKIKDIQLANGSNALRGICLSPDEKYVFISHNLGRFQVPTSQLQQGWMNTSAISIIEVQQFRFAGAVLLDDPERGAAGIWGVKCTPDKLIISHSGTHEISVVDYPKFINRFENYPDKSKLDYDLRFIYGLRERIPLEGNGPRNFVLNGNKVIIPTYFSDILNEVDLDNDNTIKSMALVENRVESTINQGERFFNDATFCFQNWQSCNGCHPGDARTDGLNWDLMNDGIGNAKNCKNLLYSHFTPPSMISGIRPTAEFAVRAGFKYIQFADISENFAACVDDYLKSLKAVPSPYLVNGELSENAKLGRKVFEKTNCDECHSGIYFTDQKMHRIGQNIEFEQGWDTPTLSEVWRTAPYLFDGRASTLKDVFETHKHGIKDKLSKKNLDDLVEYVNSL